jgi:hypothetical protein
MCWKYWRAWEKYLPENLEAKDSPEPMSSKKLPIKKRSKVKSANRKDWEKHLPSEIRTAKLPA